MKIIEIDDELYTFIASQTKHIGENASDILRRLLLGDAESNEVKAAPVKAAPAVKKAAPVKARQTKTPSQSTTVSVPLAVEHGSGDIEARLTSAALAQYTKRVDLFLFILSELHDLHSDAFANVEQIKGKNRIYFATSKDALLSTGSSTNPKSIPDSPYWVVTNNNTAKKVAMLEQVMKTLGYSDEATQTVIAKFA